MTTKRKRDREAEKRLTALFDREREFHAPVAHDRRLGVIVPPLAPKKIGNTK
jgi:hypothetical protein